MNCTAYSLFGRIGFQIAVISSVFATACNTAPKGAAVKVSYSKENLPKPYQTRSDTRYSKVLGWPKDKTPTGPGGFVVTRFAEGLNNPRWLYEAANGDVFVAESNTILRGIKKSDRKN